MAMMLGKRTFETFSNGFDALGFLRKTKAQRRKAVATVVHEYGNQMLKLLPTVGRFFTYRNTQENLTYAFGKALSTRHPIESFNKEEIITFLEEMKALKVPYIEIYCREPDLASKIYDWNCLKDKLDKAMGDLSPDVVALLY